MEKLTMQSLADALGVSRITVWKALTGREGVSEPLRQKILEKAEETGYRREKPVELRPVAQQRTFSVVVSRPESSAFWMEIIHHIAKELDKSGINLMYTYMRSSYTPGYALPTSLGSDAVDGFIVLNIYDKTILHMLTESPLPKVYLDTLPSIPYGSLNGDLVIIEGRACVREITLRLLKSGYTRLGFIGDVEYAQTNMDRYQGFLDAHRELGLTVDFSLCRTSALGLNSHAEEIDEFLSGLSSMPDGFVCPSDFIAHFIERYMQEHGVVNPPVLTGFDNSAEYPNVAGRITTVDVDTHALGKRLARQMIYRMDYPRAPFETTYVAPTVLYRDWPKR